jgi:RNA polymerase sigma-70 factor (ECF subfamily)
MKGIAMLADLPGLFLRVKSALMRRGQSECDAEDILHDAWLQFQTTQQKQEVKSPEAFVMKVALNMAIDAHRMSLTRGEQVLPEDEVILDGSPSAEDVVLSRELAGRVIACLAQMNDKTRAIFLASKLDGMKYNEIAAKFGMTRSGVEWHISKAVMQLSDWMEGW